MGDIERRSFIPVGPGDPELTGEEKMANKQKPGVAMPDYYINQRMEQEASQINNPQGNSGKERKTGPHTEQVELKKAA